MLIYVSLTFLTLTAFVVAVSLIISNALNNKEQDFLEYANNQYLHAVSTMRKQNAILNGLSAHLDTTDQLETSNLAAYSRKILERHPEVYQILFAHFFPGEELTQHFSHYSNQNPEFQIRAFEPSQGVVPASESQPWYIPIIYAASRTKSAFEQTGLDLQSIPFIYDTVEQALRLESVTSLSTPFENFEGNKVMVMLQQSQGKRASNSLFFAFLIIDTEILLNKTQHQLMPTNAWLYLGEALNEEALLIEKSQPELSKPKVLPELFPTFYYIKRFEIGNKLVTVKFSYHVGLELADYLLIVIFSLFFVLLMVLFILMLNNQLKLENLKSNKNKQLYQLANFDAVTGLANRNFFFNALSHAIKVANRQLDPKLRLLYLDLDGFKAVNDNIGHDAGDDVLKRVADALRLSMREGDVIARLGGDEFTILIENPVADEHLSPILERMREAIGQINKYQGIAFELGVSIGSAAYPEDGESGTELMNCADQRMYQDKRNRKKIRRNILAVEVS